MPDNKTHSSITPGILAKLRKIFGLNIGTVMFGAILIYMIFSVILYLTASHMESYQVPSGPLSMNETYTGLSIMVGMLPIMQEREPRSMQMELYTV